MNSVPGNVPRNTNYTRKNINSAGNTGKMLQYLFGEVAKHGIGMLEIKRRIDELERKVNVMTNIMSKDNPNHRELSTLIGGATRKNRRRRLRVSA
jgi:hypothetical protein